MKIYLDLLPQQRKQEIKRRKLLRKILREEAMFLFPVIIFILILLDIYYLVGMQRNDAVAAYSLEQSQDKYQELNSYDGKFKEINGRIALAAKIQAGHLHWTRLLEELGAAAPDGISISNLSTKNYQVFLAGKAKNREDLLAFKSALEKSQCLHDVNVPLSDLVVKTDVDFQIDLYISEDCIKKQ